MVSYWRNLTCRASLTLFAVGLVACGGGGGSSRVEVTTGQFSLAVTDAAVDSAERVLVQFRGAAVKPQEGPAISLPLAGDSQSCEQLLNAVAPAPAAAGEPVLRCIDLLSLQGTASTELIDGASLEPGPYNWIRLEVDADRGVMDSIIVTDEGAWESLYIPGGSQSGLQLNRGFTILAGGIHDFVVDFDLRKSINNPQGFPDYRLRPSLRLIDRAQSGNIVGTVDPDLLNGPACTPGAYAVYVFEGTDAGRVGEEGSANAPLTSAAVTLQGNEWRYTVGYLAPGSYTVAFTCQAGDDTSANNEQIEFVIPQDSTATVRADQDSVVNFN
ncbi:MAG: DUF4382 domain-containing protein [Halioglobus sp.]|nr:DUF4382 domain-containing protein [Halioglobus sp.]